MNFIKKLTAIVLAVLSLPLVAYGNIGPVSLASANGKIYIACRDSKQILLYDTKKQKLSHFMDLSQEPCDIIVSKNAGKLFVSAGIAKGKVFVIDAKSKKITKTFDCGHSPAGMVLSKNQKQLYLCNRFTNSVSVLDSRSGKQITRIDVLREPVTTALTPDGKSVFVLNLLPGEFGNPNYVSSIVSVIDTSNNKLSASILLPNGSIAMRGICFSPDGKWAYVTHILARYRLPASQLDRGWVNTNALSIIDVKNKKLYNTVLLDEIDKGAANPWAVICSTDGKELYVTHAGTHELSIIDRVTMHEKLSNSADEVVNDLAFLLGIRKRVPLDGKAPRAMVLVDNKLYVGEYFSDSIGVVDINNRQTTSISLAEQPQLTKERKGEILFHDATICFQQWQSCASCHPGGARMDGLNWDLLNDGLGNPKNTKSLLYAHRTPPAMATGIRKDAQAAVRQGIKNILFAVIPDQDADAIDAYLMSLQALPSPYLVDGKLSTSAQRGSRIFKELKCNSCHNGPLHTNTRSYNVGTGKGLEKDTKFDTPMLIELWRTAPYLYDGRAATIRQVFTTFNENDAHGKTSGLTEAQLDDLAEFILSL